MKLLLVLFISFNCYGFTLITSTASSFSSSKIKISITSNSTCTNTGRSPSDILDIAVEGAQKLWNSIPSSSLELKRGGVLQTSDPLFLTGELCSQVSSTSCNQATDTPAVSEIVIACNDNSINFPDSNIYAVSGPVGFSSKNISGSLILLNDRSNSQLSNLSYNEFRSLLAHEIGHAIGLGHSNQNESLMYYLNADRLNRLSQDDIDGATYLYPNKLDGCGGFLSTKLDAHDDDQSGSGPFTYSLLLGACLALALRKIKVVIRSLSLS